MANVNIPHFNLPFRFEGGAAAVVEQDSPDDVYACVQAIVRTSLGTRWYVPQFGIIDPTFELRPINVKAITDQVLVNEPRADITASQSGIALDDLVEQVVLLLG